MKRGKPLRRTPLKRGVCRIKSRSTKKVADAARYTKAKAEYQREHPRCEMPGCTRSLLKSDLIDLHHKAGRNGPLLYCKRYFASLCRKHHDMVHANPQEAREHGWIIDVSTDEVRALRAAE